MPPILSLMVEALSLTKGRAGLLASMNFLGYLAGASLAAPPLLSGSRRTWLLRALSVSSLTTAAMAFASSTVAFLALRFAGGVPSALVLILAFAPVLDRLNASGQPDLAAVHVVGVVYKATGTLLIPALTAVSALLVGALLAVRGSPPRSPRLSEGQLPW